MGRRAVTAPAAGHDADNHDHHHHDADHADRGVVASDRGRAAPADRDNDDHRNDTDVEHDHTDDQDHDYHAVNHLDDDDKDDDDDEDDDHHQDDDDADHQDDDDADHQDDDDTDHQDDDHHQERHHARESAPAPGRQRHSGGLSHGGAGAPRLGHVQRMQRKLGCGPDGSRRGALGRGLVTLRRQRGNLDGGPARRPLSGLQVSLHTQENAAFCRGAC